MKKRALIVIAAVLVLTGCAERETYEGADGPTAVIGQPEESALKEEGRDEPSQKDDEEPREEEDMSDAEIKDADALKTAVNTFNWNYYDLLDAGENMLYSPFSIESAMAMALYGAEGNTKQELMDTLKISDIDTFMEDYRVFSKRQYGEEGKLTTANSLWIDKTFGEKNKINEDFIDGLSKKMDAEVKTEDFLNASDKAKEDISDWVNDKTENLISDYSSQADSSTVLDIINAIYFFGKWEKQFMEEDTFEGTFRGKEQKPAKFMNMWDESFRYYADGSFKALEVPYKDCSLVMDLVLPVNDEDLNIGQEWKALSLQEKEDIMQALSESGYEDVEELVIPKFTMDVTANDLKGALEALGIKDAFDPSRADFSGIADNVYISGIAHRAKIEVDEEGSRAAAVTEIIMNVTSAAPIDEEPVTFICDRPFLYVIKDTDTGVILFTGLVNGL